MRLGRPGQLILIYKSLSRGDMQMSLDRLICGIKREALSFGLMSWMEKIARCRCHRSKVATLKQRLYCVALVGLFVKSTKQLVFLA